MQRRSKRTVGGLLFVGLLLTGCGGDDGGDEGDASAFCMARTELNRKVDDLKGFQLTSEEDVPEAKVRITAVITALRDMLEEAPEQIRIDADDIASGLDEVEARVEEADALELGTEVPGLLSQIGTGGDGDSRSVARVNDFGSVECGAP